jgi:hypothetical protein
LGLRENFIVEFHSASISLDVIEDKKIQTFRSAADQSRPEKSPGLPVIRKAGRFFPMIQQSESVLLQAMSVCGTGPRAKLSIIMIKKALHDFRDY